MSKLLKKLCLVGIALIIALSTATAAFGGDILPPIGPRPPGVPRPHGVPRPPGVHGLGGGGR
ncbi:MAG: hypothetical protein Q7J55_06640 [bacterium]|nr:hypothetical protein [bacterium]